jgi:hypothetical protein
MLIIPLVHTAGEFRLQNARMLVGGIIFWATNLI